MSMEHPLSINIIDGELVIRVGINVLASAIASGNDFHNFDEDKDEYIRSFAISNADRFASDVVIELGREEEDGSSPLSKLLDSVGQAAIDEGSVGIEYDQVIKFGEKSPIEKW